MNYRHLFHAGNFADVHKHVVLLALIDRLLRKPKPLFYLDTHAGAGWYDLHSADAARGAEWRAGVGLIAAARAESPDLQRYVSAVAMEDQAPVRYPGSPILAAQALRSIDRLVFVEQQIAEAHALENRLTGRRGAAVVCGDGYAALKTYLPPRENRGLVLIDPPYESEHEFKRVDEALRYGLSRWPNGVFAVWHPIKATREAERFHASLRSSSLRKLLLLELRVRPADSPLGLNGSALVIANPPWRFDEELRSALHELHTLLDPQRSGGICVEWLVGES